MISMYSRISGARDGRASLEYAGSGHGHNGQEERNILITPINLFPDGRYAEQMEPLWRKARRNHKVQTRRIVISFSKKELDPMSAKDLDTANTIVTEFITTFYPHRQAVLHFQRDGRQGCLHCHAIVNDVSMKDLKGCTHEQRHYSYVRRGIDTVASRYITLDDGKRTRDKQTRTERVKAEKAAKITKQHPELKGDALREELIKDKAYSYKEDMKQRILDAVQQSSGEAEFFRRLKNSGISVKKRSSKIYGTYYVYDFTACPISVKNTRARSYKLGYSFGPEGINTFWNTKKEKQRTNADDFARWMREKGKQCFFFDDQGKLTHADFALLDKLHEEYKQEKAVFGGQTFPPEASADIGENPSVVSSNPQSSKNAVTSRKAKHYRRSRKVKDSSDVIKRDMEAVNQLIKDASDIINRLSEEQKQIEKVKRQYKEAESAFCIESKRDREKSL